MRFPHQSDPFRLVRSRRAGDEFSRAREVAIVPVRVSAESDCRAAVGLRRGRGGTVGGHRSGIPAGRRARAPGTARTTPRVVTHAGRRRDARPIPWRDDAQGALPVPRVSLDRAPDGRQLEEAVPSDRTPCTLASSSASAGPTAICDTAPRSGPWSHRAPAVSPGRTATVDRTCATRVATLQGRCWPRRQLPVTGGWRSRPSRSLSDCDRRTCRWGCASRSRRGPGRRAAVRSGCPHRRR